MITQNVIYTLCGIWGLLAIASLLVFGLSKYHPEKDYQELIARTKSWWVMIAIFTLAMVTSRTVSLVFLGFVSFLALKEYFFNDSHQASR